MTLWRTWIVTYCTAVVMKSTKLIQSASFMKHLSRAQMERVIWWWAHETASSFHWDWISSFIDKQSQIYETWMFWTVMTFPSPDWPQRNIDIVTWFSNCLLLLAIWVRGRDSELGGRIMGKGIKEPSTHQFFLLSFKSHNNNGITEVFWVMEVINLPMQETNKQS